MKSGEEARRRTAGFSLVELVTGVVVVSVLVLLTFAGTKSMFRSADRSGCASNLRQIGVAIHLYAQDHGGSLPGPTISVQSWNYTSLNATVGSRLCVWLAPYLKLPGPLPKQTLVAEMFVCPAAKRSMGHQNNTSLIACYLSQSTVLEDGRTILPFGYYDSGPAGMGRLTPPQKISALSSEMAQVQLLIDTDRGRIAGDQRIPELPSHGTVRNCLYLDGHVAAVPIK